MHPRLASALRLAEDLWDVLARLERVSTPVRRSANVTRAMGVLCSAILELYHAIVDQASRGHALVCAILVRSLEDGVRRLQDVQEDEGAVKFLLSGLFEKKKILQELERDTQGEEEREMLHREREALEAVEASLRADLLSAASSALRPPRPKQGFEYASYRELSSAVHLGSQAVHRFAEEGPGWIQFGPKPDYEETTRLLLRGTAYCLSAFKTYDSVFAVGLGADLDRLAKRWRALTGLPV